MSAPWIFADEVCDHNKLYRFEKTFCAEKGSELTASVCADSRFKLYVNGRYVIDGPCQGTRYERHYDTVDLSSFLCEGENTVRVDVLHVVAGAYISVYREARAALWFDGKLTVSGAETPLVSDDSWTVTGTENHRFVMPAGYIPSIPPMEHLDGEDVFTPVALSVSGKPAVPEKKCFNIWGVRETYPLTPRPIPHMTPEVPVAMRCIRSGDTWSEYDAGRYETAFVHLCVSAEPGTTVRVIYAECMAKYDEHGVAHKDMRDDPEGEIRGLCDTLRVGESGCACFDSYNFRSFRFVRLEGDGSFEVNAFDFCGVYYPMGEQGRFSCSDPLYNEMWNISRHTVMCCTHENFVDCPYYEQQQYDMDSALQMMFMLRMTDDTAMAKKSISDLAASQLPDGMLQANYPSTVVQVIPSFSLFWVMMLRDYLMCTGDKAFVRRMTGTMEKVLEAFEVLVDDRGLVGVTPYWHFVDWVPIWTEGIPDGADTEPLTVYSLMYSRALTCAAEICRSLDKKAMAQDYDERSGRVARDTMRHCYDQNTLMLKNTPSRQEYSQHTALWAVICGAVCGEEARDLLSRALNRTDIPKCSFSMSYYLFRALEKTGLYDEYAPRLFGGWLGMQAQHCTTWCENPDSPRSECHGWSSAPIYELSSMVLGVRPLKDGFDEVMIEPHTAHLTSAEGTVPTPHGTLFIKWEKTEQGKLCLTVVNPAPEEMKIIVPFSHGKVEQTVSKIVYYI